MMKVNDELEVVMAYFMVNHTIIQLSRRNSAPKFEPRAFEYEAGWLINRGRYSIKRPKCRARLYCHVQEDNREEISVF
jgi:hypothetical protein